MTKIIENVMTHEDYRQKGYATACLDYAKQIAKRSNCYKMMLLTGSKEAGTLDFYRKAGYIWSLEDAQYESKYEKRYMAMEEAIRQLDKEGLFAVTQARGEVVVLVETMPPDEENTLRAFRLNRKGSKMFQKWLEEAAE